MEFGESLTGRMPRYREDEPAGLRQDIIDELKDHLAAGLQRELLRGGDPATAHARALEQFGDPAAVARQLWLDAMRGRIMAQRVLIGTCALVAAASLLSVGILWQELKQARRITADQAAAQVAEASARQEETLKQLRAVAESVNRLQAPNLSDLHLALLDDTVEQRPVVGASVVITCLSEEPHKRVNRTSDASGNVIFGSMPPGGYQFEIARRWAAGSMTTFGKLDVQPGIDVNKQIVCPTVPPRAAEVRVRWKWPADLEKEGLVLNASFGFRGVESASGFRWKIYRDVADPQGSSGVSDDSRGDDSCELSQSILCGPSEKVARFKMSRGLLLWGISTRTNEYFPSNAWLAWSREPGSPEFAHALEEEIENANDHGTLASVEAGVYELIELLVLAPVRSKDVEEGVRRFNLVASARPPHHFRDLEVASKAPTKLSQEAASRFSLGVSAFKPIFDRPTSISTIELSRNFWVGDKNHFEVKPGQANEWTITLPDELSRVVRNALKAEKTRIDSSPANAEAIKGDG
jgi:hypothetical protein